MDVLEEMGGFDESLPMGIDWDLWLRIAVKYEFLHLDDVTYYFGRETIIRSSQKQDLTITLAARPG